MTLRTRCISTFAASPGFAITDLHEFLINFLRTLVRLKCLSRFIRCGQHGTNLNVSAGGPRVEVCNAQTASPPCVAKNSAQNNMHVVAVVESSAHQPSGNELIVVEINDGVWIHLLNKLNQFGCQFA